MGDEEGVSEDGQEDTSDEEEGFSDLEMDEELSDDFVEVQFGSCQEDRMTFARFLNRKAPGRFGVVYVKKYEFVGTCLWFRMNPLNT